MFNADDLKKKFLNDIETARSESQGTLGGFRA